MLKRLHDIMNRIVGKRENVKLPAWNADNLSSPFAVPNAIEWLLRADDSDRLELGQLLAGLMRTIGPHDWTRLYTNFRSPWIKPGDIATLERLPTDDAVELLGVATLSASGYTREAALRALRRLGHRRAVPYVLLRLGDWVEEVRGAAVETFRSLVVPGVASELIEHHYLIEHLRIVDRVDLSELADEIRDRLRAAASRTALESGLTAERAATRLFCFRLLEDEFLSKAGLIDAAIRDKDPVVRSWIAGRVARGELDVTEETVRSLLCDKASRVSTTMIRALSPERITFYRDVLLDLTMGDARPVRESARFALRRTGNIDFAAACRARLDRGPVDAIRPGWVACLGEAGNAGDFDRLSGFLGYPRSRVRAAAVTAIGRVDPDQAAPLVVSFLSDSSGRVRRAAIAVLSEAVPALWAAAAYDILATGVERGQLAALSALTARGNWDAVPAMLHGLITDSELVAQRAWHSIHDWYRRHSSRRWIRPSAECLARIASVWPTVRGRDDAPYWAAREWSSLELWIAELVGESVR